MMFTWMERFVEAGTVWLSLLALATWRVLPVFMIVIGIGWILKRKISPAIHALLWTIVVARFLLPFSFSSPVSLHRPIDAWSTVDTVERVSRSPSLAFADHHSLPLTKHAIAFRPGSIPANPSPTDHRSLEALPLAGLLSIILAVTIALLCRGLYSHFRFALHLRSCRALDDPQLIDLLLRECDALAVGRRPVVREVPTLAAPAVFGLFRQTICLPTDSLKSLTSQELRWILRHELAHIRRRDIAVVVMASLAGAFHWFNPLVWLSIRKLRSSVESAADRLAVEDLSSSETIAYGHLLLRLAHGANSSRKSPTLGLLPFASGTQLKRRVELLLHEPQPKRPTTKIIAAILLFAFAITSLTDAREILSPKIPVIRLLDNGTQPASLPSININPWIAREGEGPAFQVKYDIDSILDSMPQSLLESDTDRKTLLMTWLALPVEAKESLEVDGQTLIANLNARQHQSLEQTLEIWSQGEPSQVTLETRFIQTNVKTASSINWITRRIDMIKVHGAGPALATRISKQELDELLSAITSDRHGNVMLAPKCTCFDGQTASIADQVLRPFVTDAQPKGDGQLQPIVSVIDEGLKLTVTPRTTADHLINLAFEVRASKIGEISYAKLPILASKQTEPQIAVQVPATEICELSATVELEAGESIVVAIPSVFTLEPGSDSDRTTLLIMTPTVISALEPASEEPTIP